MEEPAARGRSVPLPVRGRSLREGQDERAGGEPGRPHRLCGEGGREREILAVEVADTESEVTYQDLFRSLKRRWLKGVELVDSDDLMA